MIYISYSIIEEELPRSQFGAYIDWFPKAMRKKLNAFKKWEDTHLSLFGKLLLLESLQNWGYDREVLQNLQYSSINRPYLAIGNHIDFNISHAGSCVVCVVSDSCRVGIDIEPKQVIDLSDFESCMRKNEWENIVNAEDKFQEFYQYWTKKEAAIKADGRGLTIPLKEIAIEDNKAFVREQLWYLQEIPVTETYLCYLATDVPIIPALPATRIHFRAGPS